MDPAHGDVYSIQHYVIKFISDLRRSVVFSGSSTNISDSHDITEILLKVALSTVPSYRMGTLGSCKGAHEHSGLMIIYVCCA